MASVRHLGLFPFCLKSKQIVDQTIFAPEYPISMSLSDVMAMFYRVKEWRLSSWAGNIEIQARTFYEFDQSSGALIYSLPDNPKETSLIALSFLNGAPVPIGNVGFFATSTNTADENPPPVNFDMFNAQMFYASEGIALATPADNRTPIVFDENNFWPQLIYYGQTPIFSYQDNYFDIEDYVYFSIGPFALPTNYGTTEVAEFALTFLEKTFTLPVYIQTPEPPNPDDFPEIVAAVTARNAAIVAHAEQYSSGSVEAVEYWPYDPGDGLGPIYDSATGRQLRPFPS